MVEMLVLDSCRLFLPLLRYVVDAMSSDGSYWRAEFSLFSLKFGPQP